MKTLRPIIKIAGINNFPVSLRDLARQLKMNSPVSLSGLADHLVPKEKKFSGIIETPTGTPLGGNVNITFRKDGSFTFSCNMHDSGFPDFDFMVRAIFVAANGVTFIFQHSGHVEGTISFVPLVHEPGRDDDFIENGNNPFIAINWLDILNGKLFITKEYSATGIPGFIQDVTKALLSIGTGAIEFTKGVVVGLGKEIGKAFENLGIGATFGVIAGVVVFAVGGSLVLATIAGVATGLVTNAMIKQRPLSGPERNVVAPIFLDSLPLDKIVLTNLSGLGGRAFTMPGIGGKIFINLGSSFGDPLNATSNAYPVKGQLLIHELTHAWQIEHSSFLPGLICEAVVNQTKNALGENVYEYPGPGPAWSSFNLEQQGAIVDQWFGGMAIPSVPVRKAHDSSDPYFVYIRDNIRAGKT